MNFGRFGKIASVSLIGAMLLAGCSGNGQTVMKIGDTNIMKVRLISSQITEWVQRT